MALHAQVYVHEIITRTFDNYFPGTIYVLEYFVSFWYLNLNFFLLTFFSYIFFFTFFSKFSILFNLSTVLNL